MSLQIRTPTHEEITDVLRDWNHRDDGALRRLMPEVVDELRRLARGYFSRESPGHTLQPTALVNEVYLRLASGKVGELQDRGQFFAFAARLMREILVDHARARRAAKRGGGEPKAVLDSALGVPAQCGLDTDTLIGLDDALERLACLDPRQRTIVELRYFVGLTLPEIAEVLEVSLTTVERGWRVARRWLAREMA
ncbi:MAG: ECF-type sigma factor [Acidobacteriota bacterium]